MTKLNYIDDLKEGKRGGGKARQNKEWEGSMRREKEEEKREAARVQKERKSGKVYLSGARAREKNMQGTREGRF